MSDTPDTDTVEQTEVEAGSETNGAPDADSMDLQDLSNLINETEVPALEAEEPVDEVVEAAPEEVVEPEQPEAESEAAEDTQEEIDPLDEIRTRLELAELEAKRFESKLGQQSGRAGFLERKLKETEAENERLRKQFQTGEMGNSYEESPAAQPSQPSAPDTVTAWAVTQAINSAGSQFASAHQNEPEILSEVQKRITGADFDAAQLLETSDPAYAMQEASNFLERTYLEVKRDALAKQKSELEQRRVDQAERLKAKKRAASVSTSGGADTSPKPKPAFNAETASLDDLKRAIEANRPEPPV